MKQFFTTMLIFSISFIFSSCNNAIKGYEWLEGNWEVNEKYFQATMNITKNKFTINCNDERYNIENSPINIGKAHNSYYGENGTDILALNIDNDAIAIDEEEKVIRILESEYTSYTLTKVEEPETQETKEDDDKSDNNSFSSKGTKYWTKAFDEDGYAMFDANYSEENRLWSKDYYMVLHPFVFSNDKLRGMAYWLMYGYEENTRGERVQVVDFRFHGEYEIVGNCLRVSNIHSSNKNYLKPIIYYVEKDDTQIKLIGASPKYTAKETYHQYSRTIPNFIKQTLDNEKYCLHK